MVQQMKRILSTLLIAATLLLLFVSAGIFLLSSTTTPAMADDLIVLTDGATTPFDSIDTVIKDYWAAALLHDKQKVTSHIAPLPSDYYVKSNQCRDNEQTNPGAMLVEKGRTITPSQIAEAELTVAHMADKIGKRKFSSFVRMPEESRIAGDRAVVAMDYGPSVDRGFRHIFLMNKVQGQWKIFLVSTKWSLDNDNKDYLRQKCAERMGTLGRQ